MVFDIKKHASVIADLLKHDDPQQALDRWISHSPGTGEPLNPNTVTPRKSTLRKFLKRVHGFDYAVPREEFLEYRQKNTAAFEAKDVRRYKLGAVKEFVDNVLGNANVPINWEAFGRGNRRDSAYSTAINLVSGRVVVLMLATGRRINEVWDKFLGRNGGKLRFTLSKTRDVEREVSVSPVFIDAEQWVRLYDSIERALQGSFNSFQNRVNSFLKTVDRFVPRGETISTHDLRKIYAQVCVEGDKRRVRKAVKIRDCLGLTNTSVAQRYSHALNKDARVRCSVCDKSVLQRNLRRHDKTKGHLKKAAEQTGGA